MPTGHLSASFVHDDSLLGRTIGTPVSRDVPCVEGPTPEFPNLVYSGHVWAGVVRCRLFDGWLTAKVSFISTFRRIASFNPKRGIR